MSDAHSEISAALQQYFEGFYEGDVGKLEKIFCPNAHLYSVADGGLNDRDMAAVFNGVRSRESSAQRGFDRFDRIVTIDQSGPGSAFAKVEIALGDVLYTDYLTLLKLDGRWQIVSKTFAGAPRQEVHARRAAE
jgi:hypothetical protein